MCLCEVNIRHADHNAKHIGFSLVHLFSVTYLHQSKLSSINDHYGPKKKKELFGSGRSPCFFLLFPFAFARSRFFSRLLNRKTTRNQPSLRLLNVRSEAGRFNFFCVKSIAIVLTPYSPFFLSPVMVGFLPYTSNYFYPVLIQYGVGIVLDHLNI